MKIRAVFFMCLLLACPARAQESITADRIISGDEIGLQDKRVLRLAGIKAVGDAKNFLESAIRGHVLILQDAKQDRYGRIAAIAAPQGENQSIEEMMLGRGLAFVYPAVGDDDTLDAWLALEKTARQQKTGFWADEKDISARDAAKFVGTYGFVIGIVTKAERIKNKVYLSLGDANRPDFTLIIAAHFLRVMKGGDMDALALTGKTLRMRGWIADQRGASITLTDPHQIELVE